MSRRLDKLRILVVDDEDLLLAETGGFSHPAIEFSSLEPAKVSASRGALSDRDIVVVGVETSGGLDLVTDLCSRPNMPPVIALAGRGAHGKSLEHVLLLAELRGAALSLPKPIDAIELALAAIELIRAKSGVSHMSHVAEELERRLEY